MTHRRDAGTGATITALTYQGRTVDLCVSDKGIFYAVFAEERIEAKSLDGLKDKLKRLIDSLGKIAVPVTLMTVHYDEEPVLVDAVLLRLNRGRAVVRDADGDEDIIGYDQRLLRRQTPEQQVALVEAWKAYHTAEDHYNALVEAAEAEAPALLREAAEAAEGERK